MTSSPASVRDQEARPDRASPDHRRSPGRIHRFIVIRSRPRPKMRSILRIGCTSRMAATPSVTGSYRWGCQRATLAQHVASAQRAGPQRRWPRKQPIKGLVFHVARRLESSTSATAASGSAAAVGEHSTSFASDPGVSGSLSRETCMVALHDGRLDLLRRGALGSQSADGRAVATAG
jgi:hypothetical protein